MSNIRELALKVLKRIDSGLTAQEALERTNIGGNDRRFCSDLVYGVLRTRIRLNKELARLLPEIDKLPKDFLLILYMGAYGIFFQDRAQDHAVVNETVNLAKGRFGQRLANVANAVLRRLSSERKKPNSVDEDDPAQWAVPQIIADLWREAYGSTGAISLMRRSWERPWACVRVNPRRAGARELWSALTESPHAQEIDPGGVAFPPGALPREIAGNSLDYWMKAGFLSHQAAGSQMVLAKLDVFGSWINVPIWDACAGAGGKTLALLEQGLQVSVASDVSFRRLRQLLREAARLHLPAPACILASAAQPPLDNWQGNILVDAPCSGLGVLASRPDIKERFPNRDMAQLLSLQEAILQAAAALLRPGRELAYLTCTLHPRENQRQIEKLCEKMRHLEIVCQWQTPLEHEWLEGMYGCRLRHGG